MTQDVFPMAHTLTIVEPIWSMLLKNSGWDTSYHGTDGTLATVVQMDTSHCGTDGTIASSHHGTSGTLDTMEQMGH